MSACLWCLIFTHDSRTFTGRTDPYAPSNKLKFLITQHNVVHINLRNCNGSMKFGKYYQKHKIPEWQFFYVDYKKLKKSISSEESSVVFYKTIATELKKLDKFIQLILAYDDTHSDNVKKFLVMNYMALFKGIKKHDKKLCKTTKIGFFKDIQKLSFFQYYKSIPRACGKRISLVIFDKDGTLINHEKIFGVWLVKLVNNLPKEILKNKNDLHSYLGYDPATDKFEGNSIIAKGTNDDIRNAIFEYIIKENRNPNADSGEGVETLKKTIHDSWVPLEFSKDDVEQCGNIIKLFEYLKSQSIKIAMCTSDDREPTEKMIDMLGIRKYLEDVKCGDDPVSSKPSPEPLWHICANLDVDISSTIMVGDTISDIHAGINAKAGKIVGVLSGGYDSAELSGADVILNSIDDLQEFIENHHNEFKENNNAVVC